jgi:probable H4MPT-linked C1 transfer pathway protein
MRADAIGFDIGGANIKAATSDGRADSRPFELWKHPDRLADELAGFWAEFGPARRVAVTMTGELCDCFRTKRDGVRHILGAATDTFPAHGTRVWSSTGCFLGVSDALSAPLDVAAANWHGLATFAGRFVPDGAAMLIDTGSTTTDVIPLWNGKPVPAGRTDSERLASRELVYTGSRRTPVCAILGSAVAAELFATAHDVYLRLGRVPEEPGNRATADGRPATSREAHARLSRLLGGDPEVTSESATMELAVLAFHHQRAMLVDAMHAVSARLPTPPANLILAGSGEFLAREAADVFAATMNPRPGLRSLEQELGGDVSRAACAFALAVLAEES